MIPAIRRSIKAFIDKHGPTELLEVVRALQTLGRALVALVRLPFCAPLPPVAVLRGVCRHEETAPLRPPTGPCRPESLVLHWVIPDFAIGAGGHTTIFRIAHLLETFGHRSTFWILNRSQHGSGPEARAVIRRHFFPLDCDVRVLGDNLDEVRGDGVIATNWLTAYPVRAIRNVRHRFYFVQDFEPAFHPVGSDYLLAERTYGFGFTCITAGPWLEAVLRRRGVAASSFDLAVDKATYNESGARMRSGDRVAFYSRLTTARRAVELGLLALERAVELAPGMKVDFFGGRVGRLGVPYEYVDHGVLPPSGLAELYRHAAVGVVLSATNYSLIPNEMMACGLPVIDLLGDNTREVYAPRVITLSEPTPLSIGKHISHLLTSNEARERQVDAARSYVQQLSWEKSARTIERILQDALRSPDRSP
jgi:glycosyltransferase involved in cell wall biosynthesis